tara:strand:+ start:156 stop:413 length:258 start_codon:yes stop_codon:yes gene_type:complete
MIIPVRCFTCGKVIGSKWKRYEELVLENRLKQGKDPKEDSILDIVYLSDDSTQKTPEAIALDQLGLVRYCCRRHLLGHVELVKSL